MSACWVAEVAISYQTYQRHYGVALWFDRDGESVEISRKPRRTLGGVDRLLTTVADLTAAVRAYERWYHTEYVAEASWLLRIPDIQELRRKAGYPPDDQ